MSNLTQARVLEALIQAIKSGSEEFYAQASDVLPEPTMLFKDAVTDSLERVEILMDVEDVLGIEYLHAQDLTEKTLTEIAELLLAAA